MEMNHSYLSSSHQHQNPRPRKKLRTNPKPSASKPSDPTSPQITHPCTECGKRFCSWKALFGHMRCHPERQWRGINPPPDLIRPHHQVTEEDSEVATCLLMLANATPPAWDHDRPPSVTTVNQLGMADRYCCSDSEEYHNVVGAGLNCGLFECSSCKKAFGSHQALGGHRASHKNVKGCYAITRKLEDGDGDHDQCNYYDQGHKCSVCLRVFSSGQALGGHMRCHWEKRAETPSRVSDLAFDLNLPAPLQDDDDEEYTHARPNLDLRLGI